MWALEVGARQLGGSTQGVLRRVGWLAEERTTNKAISIVAAWLALSVNLANLSALLTKDVGLKVRSVDHTLDDKFKFSHAEYLHKSLLLYIRTYIHIFTYKNDF